MGFKTVYQLLADVFPQVDARILKAVAIENSKNSEAAVEIVLSEILPYMSQRSMISNTTSIKEASPSFPSDGEAEQGETELVRRRAFSSGKTRMHDVEAIPMGKEDVCKTDIASSAHHADSPDKEKILDPTAALSCGDSNVNSDQLIEGVESDEVILLEKPQCQVDNSQPGTSKTNKIMTEPSTGAEKSRQYVKADIERALAASLLEFQEVNTSFGHEPAHSDLKNNVVQENGVSSQSHHIELINFDDTSSGHEPAHSDLTNSVKEIDGIHYTEWINFDGPQLIDESKNAILEVKNYSIELTAEGSAIDSQPIDVSNIKTTEENNYVVELTEDDTAAGPQPFDNCENADSNQRDKILLLEEAIEDAKNNKKTLFLAMESIMNMMRKVELEEKEAELAKEEASRGGLDILNKVEDLKHMLKHAKEANDMHAGEVYGERSILATEVRELQTRLFSLADERDKALSILDEMRQTLEKRLTMAEELRRSAEQEKREKEESALKALAEQEAIMEKVVQESKILQQEAEENSKLREFLMDRGRVVDTLQGEISVICQDVLLLKEKFDERVPLSQSISSSQTSCILASSGSSIKSIASDRLLDETSKISKEASPASSVDVLSGSSVDELSPKRMLDVGNASSPVGGLSPMRKHERANNVDQKELEDGWEFCE